LGGISSIEGFGGVCAKIEVMKSTQQQVIESGPESQDVPAEKPAHHVVFYEENEFVLDKVAQWLYRKIESGCATLVVATEQHRIDLTGRLALMGPAFANSARDGRHLMLDAAGTLQGFTSAGGPVRERFRATLAAAMARVGAVGGAAHSFAAYGEMVGLLCDTGRTASAIQLEQFWNEAIEELKFSLCCGYALRQLRSVEVGPVSAICDEHRQLTLEYSAVRRRDFDVLMGYLRERTRSLREPSAAGCSNV
jgi:hypothetical protein